MADSKSETGWTPGPWSVVVNDLRGGRYFSIDILDIDLHEDDNGLNDARLIAAAPDLYEALENVRKWIIHPFGEEDIDSKALKPEFQKALKTALAALKLAREGR